MSKKDYIAIAKVIKSIDYSQISASSFRYKLISELCLLFSKDNCMFNAAKFNEACNRADVKTSSD